MRAVCSDVALDSPRTFQSLSTNLHLPLTSSNSSPNETFPPRLPAPAAPPKLLIALVPRRSAPMPPPLAWLATVTADESAPLSSPDVSEWHPSSILSSSRDAPITAATELALRRRMTVRRVTTPRRGTTAVDGAHRADLDRLTEGGRSKTAMGVRG